MLIIKDEYQKSIILSAMKQIEDQTRSWNRDCVKFVRYKTGDPHFIRFKIGVGCYSEVNISNKLYTSFLSFIIIL